MIKYRLIVTCLVLLSCTTAFFRHGGGGGGSPPPGSLSVALNVQNATGSNAASTYVTLGHVFKQGDVQPSDSLIWTIGGTGYYVQKDNFATWPDGSVRHAALSAKIPAVNATTIASGTLSTGSASAPSPTAPSAATLAGGSWPPGCTTNCYNVTVNFPHFYLSGPQTIYNSGADTSGAQSVQVTCLNSAGESLPSVAILGDAGAVIGVPACGDNVSYTWTGWNVYNHSHLCNGSPLAPSTTTYTVSGSCAGAAPPSTPTADLGTSDSITARSCLSSAISGSTVVTWLSGPAVAEYDVICTVNSGNLKVHFNIRAYADGSHMTDVVFDNSWAFTTKPYAQTYNVSIAQAGSTIYSYTGVEQYIYSQWHRKVWSASPAILNDNVGAPNIQINYAYWRDTGMMPEYDTSFSPVLTSTDQRSVSSVYAAVPYPIAPMSAGFIDVSLGAGGGTTPAIAVINNFDAQWLLSQDYKARSNMIGYSDASGTGPWHFTDEATGKSPSALTYTACTGPSLTVGNATQGLSLGVFGNLFDTGDGIAHAGNYEYASYLIQPDHHTLDLLQQQANWNILGKFCYAAIHNANGLLLGFWNQQGGTDGGPQGQVRQAAWGVRMVGETAAITPDTDAQKSYFVGQMQTSIDGNYDDYINLNMMSAFGDFAGFVYGQENCTICLNVYQVDYMDGSLTQLVRYNVNSDITTKSKALINYFSNYSSGRFVQGNASGTVGSFPAFGGAVYDHVICSSAPCYPSGPVVGTTWASLATATLTTSPPCPDQITGCKIGPLSTRVAPIPPGTVAIGNVAAGAMFPNGQTGVMGGFANDARAARAWTFNLLSQTAAYATHATYTLQAWAFLAGRIDQAYVLTSGNLATESGIIPMWTIVPKLCGTYLNEDQITYSLSASSPSLTMSGSIRMLAAVDATGAVSLTGGTSTCGVMINDDLATVPVTFTNAGSENDYMFQQGAGTALFVDNVGNNTMVGGLGAASTFQFGTNSSGQDTILRFRHGTDTLKFKSNLNGSGLTTAAGVYAACSNVGGKATIAAGGANTIAFPDHVCADLSAADVTIF